MSAAPLPTFALIGNPNTGKSTIFNTLTGLRAHTGNYPGVTIDATLGTWNLGDRTVQIVDLPGTYSLAPQSPDEQIVLDLLTGTHPQAQSLTGIIAIVDASTLQRNMYLVSQLLELEQPLILVLNQMDMAARKGFDIHCDTLAAHLGVPVIPMQAHRGRGVDALADAVRAVIAAPTRPPTPAVPWPAAVAAELAARHAASDQTRGAIVRQLVDHDKPAHLLPAGTHSFVALEAGVRYGWIRTMLSGVLCRHTPRDPTREKIDAWLTHPLWGTLIFLAIMFGMFELLYSGAAPLMDALDAGIGWIGELIGSWLPDGMLRSLIVDGVIGGVGGVLVFLPQIMLLFACIAILEDCGYMARSAFLMDRLFARVGLSGRSLIPMLSSFACAIPGIMATRTIENRRDRIATLLVAPLMSCSARLPVYVLFISAFIPARHVGGIFSLQAIVLAAMYLLGVVIAVPTLWALKRTVLRSAPAAFVMELPAYKWPAPRVVFARVLDRGRDFVVQAGTIICAISIVIWALAYFPQSSHQLAGDTTTSEVAAAVQIRDSYLGQMGQWIEPAVKPLGWDWRIGVATLASFPAREVVVAVLGTIFQVGADVDENSTTFIENLRSATWPDGRALFTIPVALSIMVFFALCCQCMATVVTIQRETKSWGWGILAFSYMTILAYVGALLTYQIGSLI